METKDIILKLRTDRDMSQDELAEKLFVTRQAVSRWENGDTVPNTETLKLLSALFDVSINTLLGSPRRLICQCCGMPLDDDAIISHEPDGELNEDYCKWCYSDGNFVYDYRLSGAETGAVFSLYALGASGDMADYTVTCTGDGCAAEVRNDRLYVSCPRGRSCTVTMSDETGTLSDSVYVAHETASIRFVSAIESYCANGLPKTNLYSLAVHCYKHFILGWE